MGDTMIVKKELHMSVRVMLCVVLLSVMQTGVADPPNALRVQTRTAWPADVKTVGEAVRYVLAPTGYTLLLGAPAPREAAAIASQAISPQAIRQRTLPIDEALLAIAGPGIRLIVDQRNRLVSFGYMGTQTEGR
jgi:hypothetical protein